MIFSKDKKPTKPGWYWVKAPWLKDAVPQDVCLCGPMGHQVLCLPNGQRIKEDSQIEWGNRIPLPRITP